MLTEATQAGSKCNIVQQIRIRYSNYIWEKAYIAYQEEWGNKYEF